MKTIEEMTPLLSAHVDLAKFMLGMSSNGMVGQMPGVLELQKLARKARAFSDLCAAYLAVETNASSEENNSNG